MDQSDAHGGELMPAEIDRLQELADSERLAAWVIDRSAKSEGHLDLDV